VGWAKLRLWRRQVGRVEIVFASDADQGEERIPTLLGLGIFSVVF